MVALIAGMMLDGCSKDESSEEQKRNNMEQANALLKKQIVGVWRNGDYWVSFSDGGYYSAFFLIDGEERIDEGSYTIDGNVITVICSGFFRQKTTCVIKDIAASSVSLTVEYVHPDDYADPSTHTVSMALTKSGDTPCEKDDGLDGKTFEYTETFSDDAVYGSQTVTFTNKVISRYHLIEFTTDMPNVNGAMMGQQYYVYLPPRIYHARVPHANYAPWASGICIGVLTTNEAGQLKYDPVRRN